MEQILKEIQQQLNFLKKTREFEPHESQGPAEVIASYLSYRQDQRNRSQQLNDLIDLQDLIQQEQDEQREAKEQKEAITVEQARQKAITTEHKKLVKQLSKLDLCSPEAAKQLLAITKNRR